MRITSRLACAATVGALLCAAAVTLAGPATAAPTPPVTLTGSAPATTHGSGTVRFTYSIVVADAVTSTVFSTHQDAALPASAAGVTLDGTVVPAGQITKTGADLSVQTGALAADGLSAGTHTVSFTATVGTATATTSSTADLSWAVGGTPGTVTSDPVLVAVNQIDLSTVLTPDSGEDEVGPLGTGQELDFAIDVQNVGYGTPSTQLDLDLPLGVALGEDGAIADSSGTQLTCRPAPGNAQHLICDLGVLAHATANDDPTIDIDLVATSAARVGHTVTITATAAPKPGQGTDVNPANNSASARLKFTGAAALSYAITPAKKKVELGASTTVTLTVHNAGPQPTGETIAVSVVIGDNFVITGFTGNTTPPADLGGPSAGDVPTSADGVIWFAGNIAAGHSVSAMLTLKATALGTSQVGLFALSEAGDPNCPDLECEPTTMSVQAVAVTPKPNASKPHVPSTATAPTPATGPDSTAHPDALANTGTSTGPELGVGTLLLLSGLGLLLLGRRRPRRARFWRPDSPFWAGPPKASLGQGSSGRPESARRQPQL